MRLLCLLLAMAWLAPGAREPAAAPHTPRRPPPYYNGPDFDREIPKKPGAVKSGDVAKLLEGAGSALALPGFTVDLPVVLRDDGGRRRDAVDALAERAQGEWKKVGETYVLVVEPRLLDAAELPAAVRERRARELLRDLVASLNARQLDWLGRGRPFSVASATLAQ